MKHIATIREKKIYLQSYDNGRAVVNMEVPGGLQNGRIQCTNIHELSTNPNIDGLPLDSMEVAELGALIRSRENVGHSVMTFLEDCEPMESCHDSKYVAGWQAASSAVRDRLIELGLL